MTKAELYEVTVKGINQYGSLIVSLEGGKTFVISKSYINFAMSNLLYETGTDK